MTHSWFKPKRYGFGAAPATWQGWALTVIYIAIMIALATAFAEGDNARPLTFGVLGAVATLAFVVVAWRTTEGGWRWRWGDKD